MPFAFEDLRFSHDRTGTELPEGRAIEFALDYDELGLDADEAPTQLGARLSALLGGVLEDEEGIFDLLVHRDGELVATLSLACEDDVLEVIGERVSSLVEAHLAEALLSELSAA